MGRAGVKARCQAQFTGNPFNLEERWASFLSLRGSATPSKVYCPAVSQRRGYRCQRLMDLSIPVVTGSGEVRDRSSHRLSRPTLMQSWAAQSGFANGKITHDHYYLIGALNFFFHRFRRS
ncbi:hypothetical protein BDW75DRAFT_16904 [Aspergillus navahoensis]